MRLYFDITLFVKQMIPMTWLSHNKETIKLLKKRLLCIYAVAVKVIFSPFAYLIFLYLNGNNSA
ncbi:hypothetical protein T03_4437 [Trichinella britovi]|uniref:Uncharacterized protein n=1 Tax=Trichinella britovi TaxID=45882 RepID=A0A0V1CPB1_TRIBR|nr:hypothetical protein T09_6334 [Trichinella sp. T9]KRY51129.1 hypothetical protein T03_4437 [Trichinella britovi]